MHEVIAIIRPERWHATQATLERLAPPPSTQHRVLGRGRELGLRFLSRLGAANGAGVRYLPKRMVTWVVEEAQVAPLVEAIIEANRTGALGDGKIFVLPVEKSIPISADRSDAEEKLTEWVIEVGGDDSLALEAERAHAPGK